MASCKTLHTIKTKRLKNILIILISLFWTFYGFGQNTSKKSIFKEIELIHTDDECGEWGGNTETILVYRNEYDGQLFIEYKKRIMDCDEDPITYNERKDYDEKKTIKSTSNDIKLISLCIKELTDMKLSRSYSSSIVPHSGIFNKVVSHDSTLIIEDYPSKEWPTFEKLKKRIIGK